MGVSDDLKEQYYSAMLHDNIKISRLMVKKKSRDAKRARSSDGGSSKGRINIQEKPRFKKRSCNKVPTEFPRARDDRVSNPKSQKGRGTRSLNKKPTCEKCGKKNYGDCLVGMYNFFWCSKSDHRVRIA